jgi:glycosyltransferase involved in cell wall biosynthesis
MKILFVANTDWYLYNFRLSLAKYLKEVGYEVVMVSPPGEYVEEIKKAGFRWIEWNVGRKTLSILKELPLIRKLWLIFIKEKPNIVHNFTIKPVFYGSICALLTGIPRIVNAITGRGYLFLSNNPRARIIRPLLMTGYRILFQANSFRFIFENEDDMQFFLDKKMVTKENSVLIHSVGVDLERFQPAPEHNGMPLVIFPARMLLDKGIEVFIGAARHIHPKGLAKFILVGSPDPGNPTSVDEKTIYQWQQEGFVEYWGWCADMVAIFHMSHVVVLPSFHEGVPTVLIEAAASSRPIVATDIAGCRVVVKHGVNGYLIPVNDVDALVAALEVLLQDKELRQRMGVAGRQIALRDFSAQVINQKTFLVYQQNFGNL